VYWIGGLVLTLVACCVPFSLINNRRQMQRFDILPNEKLNRFWREVRPTLGRTNIGERWNRWQWFTCFVAVLVSFLIFVALVSALTLGGMGMSPTGIRQLDDLIGILRPDPRFCFRFVGLITQILAFYIPLNIILLNYLREKMYLKLKLRDPGPVASKRLTVIVLLIVPISILYLASVLSFTHNIYAKIPESKAGGNYEGARLAHVHLIRGVSLSTCSSIPLPEKPSSSPDSKAKEPVVPLDTIDLEPGGIILEEDGNWMYLAKLEEGNCPEDWGKSLLEVRWTGSPSSLPELRRPASIFAINRSCVEYVTYSMRKTSAEADKDHPKEDCPAREPPQP
jgi:hypothetical protein